MKKVVATKMQINKLIISIKKAFKSFHIAMRKIWIAFLAANSIIFAGCGSTIRASVTQPKDKATTHITITTNTPISTEVDPNTNVNFNLSK